VRPWPYPSFASFAGVRSRIALGKFFDLGLAHIGKLARLFGFYLPCLPSFPLPLPSTLSPAHCPYAATLSASYFPLTLFFHCFHLP
jgi:hypothetical protein